MVGRLLAKDLDGVRIVGFSLAGEETVVGVPEYNVCFDVGRAPREIISIDNVCLTHGHMDHAAGIAYYLSQRTFVGISPGRVIVHRVLVEPIRQLMEVWARIEGHPSPGEICGVEPLEDVSIRRGLFVRPFAVRHAPNALGYTLLEVRHKLKTEFHGRTGLQLVALKRAGTEIEHRVEVPILTFTGDTAVGDWMHLDFVRNSRVVLLECTFFDREHVSRARDGKHIHVTDLPKVLAAIPGTKIVLHHVTRRTDLRTAKRILTQVVSKDDLERVSFLMDRLPGPGVRGSPLRSQRDESATTAKASQREPGS
jgi:ribonuclease Z